MHSGNRAVGIRGGSAPIELGGGSVSLPASRVLSVELEELT